MVNTFLKRYSNNILFAVIIAAFSFILNYLGVFAYKLYYIDSNTNFNNSCIYFSVCSDSGKELTEIERSCFPFKELSDDISVYIKNEESGINIYGVLLPDRKLEIVDGDNFNDSDFESSSKLAVAGNLSYTIVDINNIVLNGEKYTVKGIFEDKKKPSNNYTVYTIENERTVRINKVFIIDGKSKKSIEKAFSIVSETLKTAGYGVNRINYEEVTASNFIRYQTPVIIIGFFTLFSVIFLNYILSVFWLYSVQREIFILDLIGKNTVFILFKKYMFMTVITNLTGLIISSLFIQNIDLLWISFLVFIIAETAEIISVLFGLLYFRRMDISSLTENVNE